MTEQTGNLVLDVIGWTLVGVSAIAAVGALGCVVAYSIGHRRELRRQRADAQAA